MSVFSCPLLLRLPVRSGAGAGAWSPALERRARLLLAMVCVWLSLLVTPERASAQMVTPPGFLLENHSATDGVGAAYNRSVLPLYVRGANTLLIAAWHSEFDGGEPDAWQVKYAGVPGTLLVETNGYTDGAGNRRFRIYYWVNPTPGSRNLVVSNPYTGPNELSVAAILLTNVAQANPLGAVAVNVSTSNRTAESETVDTTPGDLVVHVIANRFVTRGVLGSGETSRSIANDGLHMPSGDASLWISTKPGGATTTTVSSANWDSSILNGVAIVVHGSPDLKPPAVTITSPAGSFVRVPTNHIVFSGTASDNVGIASVSYQQEDGPWVAIPTNFSVNVPLQPGTNRFRVDARDLFGNSSPTQTVTVFYAVSNGLQLKVVGDGTVLGATNGQGFELGRSYTLKAVPKPGNLLSNWIVGGQSVVNPSLTFLMSSNATVWANFVTNPFIALQGDYSGLFYDTNAPAHETAGLITVRVTSGGAYSAKLLRAGATLSASGKLGLALSGQTFVRRKAPLGPLTLELQLTGGSDQLTGSVSDGIWSSSLFGYRAGFSATHPATNLAGKYTLLLSGASDPAVGPSGNGFSTITVSSAGRVQGKGLFGDGSALSCKAVLSADGQCAFYQSLFKGGGSAFGWLAFSETDTNDVHGLLLWTKPGGVAGAFYPDGYVIETTALGSRYVPPPSGGRALELSTGVVLLQAGNLSLALTNDISVEANNTVTIAAPNPQKLALKLTTSSGLLSGSFTHPDTLKSTSVKGVILQKQEVGGGFFPGLDQTGALYLGRPEDFPLFAP